MKNKKDFYIGKVFNTEWGELVVVEYSCGNRVKVKFLNTGYTTETQMSNIRRGCVKDWMAPNVFGVASNNIKESITSPYYKRWHSMLRRCYDEKYQNNYPTYKGCEVSDEWKVLSNFKNWMKFQKWEGMHLDKDILGDGKRYDEDVCVFIHPWVNTIITEANAIRGQYPIGVNKDGNYLRVKCRDPFLNKDVTLGYLREGQEQEGYLMWKSYKKSLVDRMYLEGIIDDKRVFDSLSLRYA